MTKPQAEDAGPVPLTAKNALSGRAIFALVLLFSGCSIDPEYGYRFDHCMEVWLAQETAPDMSIKPQGHDLTEYCIAWARGH